MPDERFGSPEQAAILDVLADGVTLSTAEITALTNRRRQNVGYTLTGMYARGLIERIAETPRSYRWRLRR